VFILIILIHPFVNINFLYKLLRFWSKNTLRILFVRTKIIYEEEIDKNGTYIFMPNHTSIIDVLLASAYWPVNINAIEAHKHFKWFLYGKIIRIFGQIPINRNSATGSLKSFEIAKERLKIKRSIIVFPEGTRSRNGELRAFKNLPFKFAKESNTTIVPVAMLGILKMSPENSFWIKPAKVTIVFGKQIKTEQINELKFTELREKVKNDIVRMKNKYK